MDGNEPKNPNWQNDKNAMTRSWYWKERCLLAEQVLSKILVRPKDIGRAFHIHQLEAKIKRQRHDLTEQRKAAEVRNLQLGAANLIVACSGGCDGGIIGDKNKVTEELVQEVERTAKRLRQWYGNYLARRQRNEQDKRG